MFSRCLCFPFWSHSSYVLISTMIHFAAYFFHQTFTVFYKESTYLPPEKHGVPSWGSQVKNANLTLPWWTLSFTAISVLWQDSESVPDWRKSKIFLSWCNLEASCIRFLGHPWHERAVTAWPLPARMSARTCSVDTSPSKRPLVARTSHLNRLKTFTSELCKLWLCLRTIKLLYMCKWSWKCVL